MIRVLQCVNDMHRAGLETMLMNYYRNIDRTKIQFDFLTHRPDKSDFESWWESILCTKIISTELSSIFQIYEKVFCRTS